MIRLYCAEDLDFVETVPALREQIEMALADPEYSIITNFIVEVVDVPTGALVYAKDADEKQMDYLRAEVKKVQDDPEYIAVIPFFVTVGPVICGRDTVRPPTQIRFQTALELVEWIAAHRKGHRVVGVADQPQARDMGFWCDGTHAVVNVKTVKATLKDAAAAIEEHFGPLPEELGVPSAFTSGRSRCWLATGAVRPLTEWEIGD